MSHQIQDMILKQVFVGVEYRPQVQLLEHKLVKVWIGNPMDSGLPTSIGPCSFHLYHILP